MRGLNEDSAQTIMDANRIYYNFIRPHMALNGLTPAEGANLKPRTRTKQMGRPHKTKRNKQKERTLSDK